MNIRVIDLYNNGDFCFLYEVRAKAEATVNGLRITETSSVLCETRAQAEETLVELNATIEHNRI